MHRRSCLPAIPFRNSIFSLKHDVKNCSIWFSQRQQSLPPERCEALQERLTRELVEFLSVYEGKLLGTSAWRRMIERPESLVNVNVKPKLTRFPFDTWQPWKIDFCLFENTVFAAAHIYELWFHFIFQHEPYTFEPTEEEIETKR